MPRAKRGVKARRRRNKVMKAAKGFVGARRRLYRPAVSTVERALRYAFRDRRQKKREFRELWIMRINAAARMCGATYAKLMGWLKQGDVGLDRKTLADMAVSDFPAFEKLVESVRPSE
jgi:large subunit ribosomal protein L20